MTQSLSPSFKHNFLMSLHRQFAPSLKAEIIVALLMNRRAGARNRRAGLMKGPRGSGPTPGAD